MAVRGVQCQDSWTIQDNRHTQNSAGAVCVAVLAVNQQEEETPTGLQVHQAVSLSGADCHHSVTNTNNRTKIPTKTIWVPGMSCVLVGRRSVVRCHVCVYELCVHQRPEEGVLWKHLCSLKHKFLVKPQPPSVFPRLDFWWIVQNHKSAKIKNKSD